MKISKYNSTIHLNNGKSLIYNSMSDQFVVLNSQILSDGILNSGGIKEMRSQKLLDAGIIVPKERNEYEEFKKLLISRRQNETVFQLHINPTLSCNFKCWYCYEVHKPVGRMSDSTISNILKFVKKKFNRQPEIKDFILSFFGGEPMMYFDQVVKPLILRIADLCREHNVRLTIQFTSNGFLFDKERIEFFRKFPSSFQITLDGYRDFHNRVRFQGSGALHKGSYDKIISNIKALLNGGNAIVIRINYTSDNIDSISEIVRDLDGIPEECRNHLIVDFQQVWQDIRKDEAEAIYERTAPYLRQVRELGIKAGKPLGRDQVRYPCYADYDNYALVNFDGKIFLCTARDFNESNSVGFLNDEGEIEWDKDTISCRRQSIFKNKTCIDCRILGICGGGCNQKKYDMRHVETCPLSMDEDAKDDWILAHFENSYLAGT